MTNPSTGLSNSAAIHQPCAQAQRQRLGNKVLPVQHTSSNVYVVIYRGEVHARIHSGEKTSESFVTSNEEHTHRRGRNQAVARGVQGLGLPGRLNSSSSSRVWNAKRCSVVGASPNLTQQSKSLERASHDVLEDKRDRSFRQESCKENNPSLMYTVY